MVYEISVHSNTKFGQYVGITKHCNSKFGQYVGIINRKKKQKVTSKTWSYGRAVSYGSVFDDIL